MFQETISIFIQGYKSRQWIIHRSDSTTDKSRVKCGSLHGFKVTRIITKETKQTFSFEYSGNCKEGHGSCSLHRIRKWKIFAETTDFSQFIIVSTYFIGQREGKAKWVSCQWKRFICRLVDIFYSINHSG